MGLLYKFIYTYLWLYFHFLFLTNHTKNNTTTCWISWKTPYCFLAYLVLLCICLFHVINNGRLLTKVKNYHFVPLVVFHNNNWYFIWFHFYVIILTIHPNIFSLTFVPVYLQSTIFIFFLQFLLSLICILMFSNKPFIFGRINMTFCFI